MPALRTVIPVVAIVAGTWFGLHPPFAVANLRAATSRTTALPALRSSVPSPIAVPALDLAAMRVDSAELPDLHAGFPELNPDDRVDRAWLLSEGPAHAPGDGRRLVTLTFDDGPFPETAPLLLRVLAEHKVRATFFFIGEYLTGTDRRAEESRTWARRIAQAGHFVGNHTFDHRRLTSLNHTAALSEMDDSAAAIERATGVRPWLFRPPFGALDAWLEGALHDRGQDLVLWNVDVQDIKRTDPDEIARSVEEQLQYKCGGIVLLHDMHAPSVKAASILLRWLESNRWDPEHPDRVGWDVVDLASYLRSTRDSPQPYPTREALERWREHAHERTAAAVAAQVPGPGPVPVISSQMRAALPESLRSSIFTEQ
jgi:peptidoglycan/xylan/chitin deacetylase (PgdA/CDA1 family)